MRLPAYVAVANTQCGSILTWRNHELVCAACPDGSDPAESSRQSGSLPQCVATELVSCVLRVEKIRIGRVMTQPMDIDSP